MPGRVERTETAEGDQAGQAATIALKPPVTLADLNTDIEHDPEGAEEFAALIRAVRTERPGF